MKTPGRRLLAGIASSALAAVLAVAVPTPAQATIVELTSGHVDVINVDHVAGGPIEVTVGDDTGATFVERDPSTVVLVVPAAAHTAVPSGSAWSFLGSGGYAYVLPQTNTAGLLWAGWDTTGVASGALQFNRVVFKLTGVQGPGGFSIFTASGGTPTVLFDSGNGLPDSLNVNRNTHAHVNWGFDVAGTYVATFEVSGVRASNGQPVSSTEEFTFEVG
ncbi:MULTISPECIES: choice-of-anchor M domain-containing protein [Micromonosporaceae]|uniref:choice-of-anchor M domain-containing protein n=1 Tax=Micromonosporaceae TaxID=28056 RepID=UPI00249AAE2A|nr:choice-of-anchor M domain-containing protein [Solwaraspora sp. WMMD937]WFE21819.1 choice-of-anchor M domain-containing protein [Solwaraspora sp. WMMD937]WFE21830.1 choice-of-anchor M domain-containing protein [Solwaraspora sp. WMMD937]